jgi:2-dehydro-3-deoxyphosphogluconate aldolase / (4S)-4-hydroxy-2-oxoglutarate aldolase
MTLMTTTLPALDPLLQSGVIAVVRVSERVPLGPVARALAAGGVGAVEVTLTTPGAIDAIADLASDSGLAGCVIGAGTVLDESAARYVIDAGARFVVSPVLDPAVIRVCRDREIPCMPGAFTPTELLEAWRAGSPVEKLFPATAVGPGYIRDLLAPLPFLRLVPSGGVSLENAGEWIRAGAAAVSVGSALVSPALVTSDSAAELTTRARSFVTRVAEARRRAPHGAS